MGSKGRYGIKVKFSCKMCAQSYFETVEDYIEHKRENHFTEFQKTQSFIILEEKTFPVESFYKNENYKTSFVERVTVSDSLSRIQSSTTGLLINGPISTKNPSADHLTPPSPSNGDKREPVIEYETRGYVYTNPFTQNNSSENKSGPSETIIPSNVDDGRNSPDPSYLHPKSELVVFEEQIQEEEEDERSMGTETEPLAVGNVGIHQNHNQNVSSSTQYYSELESDIQEPVVKVEDAGNVSSQYYSELEGAEDPEEADEYILSVGVGDDDDKDDSFQEIPAPPPSKKSKPNPKITATQYQYHSAQTQKEIMSDRGLYPKPPFSYSNLISLALKNSRTGSLRVDQIYKFISFNFPYYILSAGPRSWKSSLRTTLTLSRCFGKIEQPLSSSGNVTACRWAVDPSVIQRMDEEIQKQFLNNPETIRAMRNPENCERIQRGELMLIGDLEGSGEDDDQDDDLSVITFQPKSQLTRKTRGRGSSTSGADSSVAPETVSSTGSKSSNSEFIVSQQNLHTVPHLPLADPPEKIQVKSEVSAQVTSASDFCEIISVQGNYLS